MIFPVRTCCLQSSFMYCTHMRPHINDAEVHASTYNILRTVRQKGDTVELLYTLVKTPYPRSYYHTQIHYVTL